MAVEEVINLKVKTENEKSVKSLKQEIKEAQAAAIQTSREFGAFSKEATAAASKVAKLKDEMGDFQQRVAGLNPDRFAAIATVTQGIAGGISAATGAMALFGAESEDTQKIMAKVQGAIAFSQGVQQILDLRNSFGAVATVIRTQVVTAFSTLKGAIASTGIGLLVIGIGILISKISELGDEAEKVDEKVKGLIQEVEEYEKGRDIQIDKRIARLKGLQGTEEQVFNLEQERIKRRINDLQSLIDNEAESNAEREKLAQEQIRLWNQIELNQINFNNDQNKRREDANKKALEDQQKHNQELLEEQKAWNDAWAELERERLDKAKVAADAQKTIQDEIAKSQLDEFDKQIFDLNEWYEKQKEILIAGGQSTWDLETLYQQKVTEVRQNELAKRAESEKKTAEEIAKEKEAIRKRDLEASKQAAAAERQAQQAAFDSTSQLLGATAALFGQTTAAGKAFALAQIGADTARALSGALANSQAPTPDNVATGGIAGIAKYIALAATILQNVGRARQILGASQQSASIGGAPQFNPITNSSSLPGSDEVAGKMEPFRVFVTEGDISRAQGRVRVNRNGASF